MLCVNFQNIYRSETFFTAKHATTILELLKDEHDCTQFIKTATRLFGRRCSTGNFLIGAPVTHQEHSQSEQTETQQHVRCGDDTLGINYFLLIFWPSPFLKD